MEEMVFGKRYRVTEKIGSGGMADVYKAVDDVLGRTVAVKVLSPAFARDPEYVARFRQEAQAAANLSSPNIVNMYDWGRENEDTYYIVMEYVRGTDLKTLVRTSGPLDFDKIAEYCAQVCAALSVAHGYGIIHRDIKPQNIVLMPEGTVKVMDFGIARAIDTLATQTGSVLGTAQYISPEQAQGRELTPSTDLYSLGVVLYELATGYMPFDGDSPVAIALKHVNDEPTPPSELDPDVPPELEAIIARAMDKSPARRYLSADEMRADLLRFAQGDAPLLGSAAPDQTSVMPPVGGPASPPPTRAPRGGSPRWMWVGIVALLLVLGVGIAYGVGLFNAGVKVPEIVGMRLAEAKKELADSELKLGSIDSTTSETVAKGNVISSDPSPGTVIDRGTEVDIVVSLGMPAVQVPDLTGMTQDEAVAAIQAVGLVVGTVTEENSKFEVGIVFKQVPLGSEQLPKGSRVDFTVSLGPKLVAVPFVVDMKQGEAIDRLQKAGFTVKTDRKNSDDVPKGTVMDQKPSAGGTAPEGSTVTIVVSDGPQLVQVPNVVTQTEADATAELQAEGFKVNVQAGSADAAKAGTVEKQDPVAGSKKPKGSEVTIWIYQ